MSEKRDNPKPQPKPEPRPEPRPEPNPDYETRKSNEGVRKPTR